MFSNTQKRSHESPMDWEWQTSGPTDPNSPFPQSNPRNRGFDSQSLQSFTSSSSTAAPPFRNPSFTTPRKPFDDSLFSEVSGAESSPADKADAEDTPEPQTSKAMTAFTSKSEKAPIFGRYGAGFAGNSPLDSKRRNKYGNAIVKKVRKRRRIDRDDAALIGTRGSETDSEDESRSKSRGQALQNENRQGWFAAFLNGIESHPNLPNVLSFYAQLTLNFFLVGLAIFGVWTFWSTIKGDVDKASDEAIAAAVADMAKCAANFVENGCQNPNRPPALETVCDNWDFCMNRDPKSVGRAKISAHTFAQIFNSFIEPISYKAMIFVVLIVTVCILVNNLAFGMFRSKSHPMAHHIPPVPPYFPAPPQQSHYNWGPVPQTPQTQHHIQDYDIYGGQAQIMPSMTPQRSPSKGEGRRSPSKGDRVGRSPSKGERY